MAWRSDVWTDAAAVETEYWRKKSAEAKAKKRSEERGRSEVDSERRSETDRMKKRNKTAAE